MTPSVGKACRPQKAVFFLSFIYFLYNKKYKKIKNQNQNQNQKVGDIGSPTHPSSRVLSIKTWCLKHGSGSFFWGRGDKKANGEMEKGEEWGWFEVQKKKKIVISEDLVAFARKQLQFLAVVEKHMMIPLYKKPSTGKHSKD